MCLLDDSESVDAADFYGFLQNGTQSFTFFRSFLELDCLTSIARLKAEEKNCLAFIVFPIIQSFPITKTFVIFFEALQNTNFYMCCVENNAFLHKM